MYMNNRQIPLLIFFSFLFLYLFTTAASTANIGDAAKMWSDAREIWDRGLLNTFDENNVSVLTKYGPGQPLLNLPFAWASILLLKSTNGMIQLFSLIIVALVPAILISLSNTLVYLIAFRIGYGYKTSAIVALATGLTTMNWFYSQASLADSTLGLFWLIAIYGILNYSAFRKGRWLFIAGFAAGYAIMLKIIAIIAIPFLFMYLLSKLYEQKKTLWSKKVVWEISLFLIPAGVGLIIYLLYNYLRYNNPFIFGYSSGADEQGFNIPLWSGIYGLLFSSGKSFFLYNLSTLVAIIGFKEFYKLHRKEALVISAIVLGQLLVHAKWYAWHGDWSWGPRFLAAVPPFLMLVALPVIQRALKVAHQKKPFGNIKKISLYIILLISFFIQITGITIDHSNYIIYTDTEISETKMYNVSGKEYDRHYFVTSNSLRHFIPEFSPIIGHIWLGQCKIFAEESEGTKKCNPPPWMRVEPPENVRVKSIYLHWNIWWMYLSESTYPNRIKNSAYLIAMLFFITAFALFYRLKKRIGLGNRNALSDRQ